MMCDGRVMCLQAETFRGLVSERLVRWVERGARCTRHRPVGAPARTRWLRTLAGELDLAATYVFDGAAEGDRALAAFLATQRGVRAFARRGSSVDLNQAGTVRSFAHARSACTESARSTDIGYVRLIAPSTSSVVTIA